jgi:pimeloyl-ACP methyl ester carboxylesterase
MSKETVVATPNVSLTVRDTDTQGPGIILLHGLSSNLAIWDLVVPLLAERLHVVCYDQRSHGRSGDAADLSFDALVADLQAVIDATGLDNPVVVGHSWGASVALSYAATHAGCPGVVCVDGGVFDMQAAGSTWEATEQRLAPPKLIGPMEEIVQRILSFASVLPHDALERVVRRGRVQTEDGLSRPRLAFEDHMRIVRHMWEQRTSELYERISCPVMAVLARDERAPEFVAAKKRAAEQLPDRVRVQWLDSVHDIPLANPVELVALIADFVTSTSAMD